jgi:hypothetical protein
MYLCNFSGDRWVAADLEAKLEILRQKRSAPDSGRHFRDVDSMLRHELAEKVIKFKARDDSTGSRNLLRLHRYLELI